jgi:hypothetical protein
VCTEIGGGPREGGLLEELGIDGTVVLGLTFKKWNVAGT